MRIRHRHSDDLCGNEKCSHDCFLSLCVANSMPEREFSLPIDTVVGNPSRTECYQECCQRGYGNDSDCRKKDRQQSIVWRIKNPDPLGFKNRECRAGPVNYGQI